MLQSAYIMKFKCVALEYPKVSSVLNVAYIMIDENQKRKFWVLECNTSKIVKNLKRHKIQVESVIQFSNELLKQEKDDLIKNQILNHPEFGYF